MTKPTEETLESLIAKHIKAKASAKAAADKYGVIIKSLEAAMLDRFDELPDEGTTHIYDGKKDVVATTKLGYSLDAKAFANRDKKLLPINIAPVKVGISLDIKAYRILGKINPKAYTAMQAMVTTKPGKPTLIIKDIKLKGGK